MEEEILNKMQSGKYVSLEEKKWLIENCQIEQKIESKKYDERQVVSILKVANRFYELEWTENIYDRSLNRYELQPEEVCLVENEIMVKTKEWKIAEDEW